MKRLLFALILAPIAMQAVSRGENDVDKSARASSDCKELRQDMMKAFRKYLKNNPKHKYVQDYNAAREHLKTARKNIMSKLPEMDKFQQCTSAKQKAKLQKTRSQKTQKKVQSRNQ